MDINEIRKKYRSILEDDTLSKPKPTIPNPNDEN
jgi:hypothetical protein